MQPPPRNHSPFLQPYRWLIAVLGVTVPRRLRADWKQEWQAELRHRELLLDQWEKLNWITKLDLLFRSLGAVRDALWIQQLRMEDEMFQDIRYGFRLLLKHRGFTFVAILTLALGVGANSAIFSVVNALVLSPLPFSDSDRIVWVDELSKENKGQAPWGGHFLDWQEHCQTIEAIAQIEGGARTLTGLSEPERVDVGTVSAGLLPVLGVRSLQLGRNFAIDEDKPGADRVAILSDSLWQRLYNRDRDVLGKSVTLNDVNYTIVGVLPSSFRLFYQFDVWVPLALDPQAEYSGPMRSFQSTVARLKPGVTIEQARLEMDSLMERYEQSRPEGKPRIESRTSLVPLHDHLLGDTRRPLLVLFGAVGLILLIACANVANLLLARGVSRQKELAIRAALGASRLRILRQLLTESLLLAFVGGVAGLLLAFWLTGLISSLNSTDTLGEISRVASISIDLRVLGFTLLVSLLTGLFCGLFPALQFSFPSLNMSLKEGGSSAAGTRSILRSVLLVSEVALSIVLLVGAGLLGRSFVKLLNVDLGYRADHLLSARLTLPPGYKDKTRRIQFYEQTLERLSSLPGVTAAAATSHLPLTNYNMGGTVRAEGHIPQSGERELGAPIAAVSPNYFRAMGIEVRSGRVFNDDDREGTPSVAVLSESLAHTLFPDQDPVGRRMFVAGVGTNLTTVIGVVNDVRHQGLDRDADIAVYLSFRQLPREMSFVLRSANTPSSLAAAVRSTLRDAEPGLAVYQTMTMDERLSNSIAARRLNLVLLGAFGALALLLASVGVYGVISYIASGRTHEIGIRMALGAQTGDVLRLFLRQGMSLSILGVGLGLIGSLLLTGLMSSLLFGVSVNDPITFVGVALIQSMIALVACYVPARRASKADPLVALRHE